MPSASWFLLRKRIGCSWIQREISKWSIVSRNHWEARATREDHGWPFSARSATLGAHSKRQVKYIRAVSTFATVLSNQNSCKGCTFAILTSEILYKTDLAFFKIRWNIRAIRAPNSCRAIGKHKAYFEVTKVVCYSNYCFNITSITWTVIWYYWSIITAASLIKVSSESTSSWCSNGFLWAGRCNWWHQVQARSEKGFSCAQECGIRRIKH